MTTTELIQLLQNNERGGITGKPRVISIRHDDTFIAEPGIVIDSSGDGIMGAEICLRIEGGRIYTNCEEVPEVSNCPCCNSTARIIRRRKNGVFPGEYEYRVSCAGIDCGLSTPWTWNAQRAKNMWDRREK